MSVAAEAVLHDAHVQAWLSRLVVAPFSYSLGRNRADAHPSVHNARTFGELQDAVLSARHDRPKELAPYFARPFRTSGAKLPQRGVEYALPCAWIALDVDTLTPPAAVALTAALAERRGFWHASLSATQENLKRRVVLECDRVVELAEHKHVVTAVESWLRERVGDGVKFDHAASADVARLWYLPAEGAAAGAFVGEPIDVDRALVYAKAHVEPEREHAQGDGPHVGEGGRNAMLTREAGKLRRIGLSPATIAAALQQMNRERCDPPLEDAEVDTIARSVGKYAPGADSELPTLLGTIYTGAALLETPATPTRWLVDGWMSEGASALIGAHGGTGKSWFALQGGTCLAAGRPFLGLTCERRRVLLYAAEDRAEVLRWRLRCIVQALQIDPATLGDWLTLIDQSRLPAELVGHDRYGVFAFAPLFEVLADELRKRKADVLVIDSASDAFGGNEIARPEVRRYICEVQRLVPDDGAVVHVVHVDKAHARGLASGQGYSGSTAWHNSVRQRWELTRAADETDDGRRQGSPSDPRRVLTLAKNNYGPAGAELALTFDAQAGIFIAEAAQGGIVDSTRERAERRGIVLAMIASAAAGVPVPAAMQGPRTAYLVLTQRPEFPDALRGGARAQTRRFARHLEGLRQIRHVVESSIRRSNRHAAAILEVTPEGCAEYANS